MKRFIMILLVCAMLIGCLASCTKSYMFGGVAPIIKSPPEEEKRTELITALSEYLKQLHVCYDMPPPPTLATEIQSIKDGAQALIVKYDPSNYYFVCGYYNSEHSNESDRYCCAENYTWVRFYDPKDISDSYNGEEFIVAFQINQPGYVLDMVNETAKTPGIEHFTLFETNFEYGNNKNERVDFDDLFIYLNKNTDKDEIYHTREAYNDAWFTIPCDKIDGEFYIPVFTRMEYLGETKLEDMDYELGKYHDALMEIMDLEKYPPKSSAGATYYYGAIGVRDLVDTLLKEDETKAELEFTAHTYIQMPFLSYAHSIDVKVINGETYLDGKLFKSIEYVENLDIVYHDSLYYALENFEPEKAPVLKAIQEQEYCYLLKSLEGDGYWDVVAAYYIDGVCYFIHFMGGMPARIHYAPIDLEN